MNKTTKYSFIDFAPSDSLSEFIRRYHFLDYRTADLAMEGVDYQVDLTNLHIFQDSSIDMFLCSHVLEHIQDDKKAIRELFRILKSGGWGIVMAPILLNLPKIYEDPNITAPEERWKHFGQDDHVRIYSKQGFIDRLNEVGFKVFQLGNEYFGSTIFEQCGIHPHSVLYVVEK
jgi:predicted SAM-dependent methyltransferase